MSADKIDKEYKFGYLAGIFDNKDLEQYGWLYDISKQCEKFVLGIPDEWIFARLYGDSKQYSAQEEKQFWIETGWFYDVMVLDAEHLSYQKVYEQLQFDVCFYGCEYGIPFIQDRDFAKQNNITFISMIPERRKKVSNGDALKLALENVQRHQKIVLFGTGSYFDFYMQEYGLKYCPAYAVDNDKNKWNLKKKGVKIFSPEILLKENAEDLLVIICNKNYIDIRDQLLEMNSGYNYRTLLFRNEISLLEEFAISSKDEREYLKNAHRILKTLMKEFDRVCRKNKLHYYFICGSLIGVVRHQAIIPWDDDIDLAMPRKDFKKLKKIAKKEWSKENKIFRFLNYDDLGGGAFYDCMPRLFYVKEHLPTKCFDKVYGKAKADVCNRMFIDIYVMDNAHENEKVHMLVINIMKGIYNLCMGHRANIDYEEYKVIVSDGTIRLMKIIHSIGRFLPLKFLTFCYDLLAQSANHNKKCQNYIMDSCAIRCIELKYPKIHFGEGKNMPFYDMEVMVPSDHDAQLHAMRYQNYMEFPRMSVRKPSHYFNSDIEIW